MLLRKALTVIAVAALATLFAAPSADAATPKAASYNAWISTQGLMYMVNLEIDYEDEVWEMAYNANTGAYEAFLETYGVETGDRGASLEVARDLLDEALVELFYLSQEDLPDHILQKVSSAMWYTNYARNVVNKNIR